MYISIDIGGTNTRIASSFDLSSIHKVVKVKTPNNIIDYKEILKSNIGKVSDNRNISTIILGVPGFLDITNHKFKFLPNIQWLNGIDALKILEGISYENLFLQNDAALAALCEATEGAGKKYQTVAYLTLSTGVGGALIENKKISTNRTNIEPGHHIIDTESTLTDGAGIEGSMEALLSGTAFTKIYGVEPINCEDKDIWSNYGKTLSKALINIITMWSPQVIVLGGSLSNKFDLFFPSVQQELAEIKSIEPPSIVQSMFMDDAGLLGGFLYIKQLS